MAGLELMIAAAERARDMLLEVRAAADMAAEGWTDEAAKAAAAAGATNAAADAAGDAAKANTEAAFAAGANADATEDVAKASTEAAAAAGRSADASGDAARAYGEQAAGAEFAKEATEGLTKAELDQLFAYDALYGSSRALSTATMATGDAASTASGFWSRWGNVIHWVIAGGAEFLAVFIPAMVAAGGAAAVMAQGIGDLYDHLMAMYDAQEANANIFHETTGEMVGMKSVLQSAQNAVDPEIFELLGAAINIVKGDAGQFVSMGVKVVGMLDEFAAKITGELTGALGGQMNALVSRGVQDLGELWAVLGNVGHAILNLASDMPGLAEVLLAVLVGASKLLEILTTMPGKIITVAMGFEEFARWGSLVSSVLGRMTGVATESMGSWYHLFSNAEIVAQNFAKVAVSSFANVYSGLGNLLTSAGSSLSGWGKSLQTAGEAEVTFGEDGVLAAGETSVLKDSLYTTGVAADVFGGEMIAAGAEMDTFAAEVEAVAAAITPLEALLAVAAAAGFGILGYEATKSTTALDAWAASLNKALGSTSDLQLIPKTVSDIADATGKLTQAQQQFNNVAKTDPAGQVASRYTGMSSAMQSATANVNAAKTEQNYLYQALDNTRNGAGLLALTYGTTFTGALALAQAAGINLSKGITGTGSAAVNARIQIANYMAGMEAMGQQAGVVGHDVTLMGIDSELSATKIQQLNQAVDDFVTNLTGGTSNLGGLQESIENIGKVTITTADALKGYSSTAGLTMSQSAQAMTSFGQVGSQVWQNFDSALSGSGEQLADWFRTAGAEGAISGPQFTKAMQDIVSEFVPFAQKSKTAQSELVGFAQAQGLNVTSFKQLEAQLKAAGASTSNLTKVTGTTTGAMADMNEVAQELGASVGTDVVGAMNSANLAASGLTGAATKLAGAWDHAHTVNSAVVSGFGQTFKALYDVYHNTGEAESAANAYARSLGLTQKQVNILDKDIAGLISKIGQIPNNKTFTITGEVAGNAAVVSQLLGEGVSRTTVAHARGYQSGTSYATPGPHVVGEAGPEVVMFHGGEQVIPAWQTAGITHGQGTGGGEGTINLLAHVPLNVSGQKLGSATIRQSLTYSRRNPRNNLSLRAR